jgi:hypothetical protein
MTPEMGLNAAEHWSFRAVIAQDMTLEISSKHVSMGYDTVFLHTFKRRINTE